MIGHKVRIKQTGRRARVALDDLEMRYVKYIEFRSDVDELPVVILEFYTTDVEIETEGE